MLKNHLFRLLFAVALFCATIAAYANNSVSRISAEDSLSLEVRQWVNEHRTIRVGYRDNYLPFCQQNPETGVVEGLLSDICERLKGSFGYEDFEIEAVAYSTINDAIDAVKKGEVDAAFPYGASREDAEAEGLILSKVICNSVEMAVTRTGDQFRPEDSLRAAINYSNPNYLSLLRVYFPHWKIVNFPTTHACLEGIERNEADLLILSNFRLGMLAKDVRDNHLKAVPTGKSIPYGFVTRLGEPELYAALFLLSDTLDDTFVQSSLVKHSDVSIETSVTDFMRENSMLISFLALAIVVVIFFFYWRSHKAGLKAKVANAKLLEAIKKQHEMMGKLEGLNVELAAAKEQAEAANAAKTSFLFNMSHDIRTPMNAIIGFTNLLRKNQENPNRREDCLNKIENSSNILLSIINNVLEMARIEKGTVTIEETPCIAEEFNDSMVELFNGMMKEKKLSFYYSIDVLHHYVLCDTTKLREVFANILSNAYKYTPSGGSVSMVTEELPSDREGYALFRSTVKDTGIGMSDEFVHHMFEEFSREKGSAGNQIEGTGLGLSIVKRLVELMGGSIEVHSKKGVGTTFILTMQFKIVDSAKSLKEGQETEVDPAAFAGNRILLAEDNDLNAEIAMEILREVGFVVERANNGVVCVEMLRHAAPGYYSAVLMDIQMPKMNGYEATQAIRALADPEKATIPILALTANAFEEDVRRSFEAGMNGHLSKPIDESELVKKLASLF